MKAFTIRITPQREANKLLPEELEFVESLCEDHWDTDNGAYCFNNYFANNVKDAIHTFRLEHLFLTTSSFNFEAF